MTDTVISHYRVLNQLGEGGMGVVYRAEDLRLGREVAIKFLRSNETDHAQWLARFEREARLSSALKHPHICTIHEFGEHEGRPFIVMELLEGRTVKQILESGPIAIDRLVDFAIQIGSALEAAHDRGIVHRDIKPANLFVTHGDLVKILDFGLAKLTAVRPAPVLTDLDQTLPGPGAAPDVTTTGAAVGTAAYMSPEQATGGHVDARTDLFSFGSVLYEMATGRRAFPGDSTPLVLQRLLSGEVIPPVALNPAIPARLEAIIQRALQVEPASRYQSAQEMLTDLRALARDLSPEVTARATPAAGRPRRRWVRWGVAAALGVAGTFAAARWLPFLPRTPALTERDTILVGSFTNNTGDPVFDETLVTALRVQLSQSPFLDLVADDRVRETLRLMGREPDERLTPEIGREVCQRLGAKAALDGSVSTLGANYVLMLTATDCSTGESVGREQGEATGKEGVLRVLGSLASSMRTTLGESLPSIRRFDVPIEQATTPSLAALKAYTLGQAERRRGRELESIAFFNQAIEIDTEFAAAYTTLSTVYGSLNESRRSDEYARLAYARRQRVSERERLLITYQYHDRVTGDFDQAMQTLEVWKASYPRDFQPANALAVILNRLGRYEEAVEQGREALRRRPGHPFAYSNLAVAHRGLGQFAEARKVGEEAVALGVATSPTRRLLYQLGMLAGDGSAAQYLESSRNTAREFDFLAAQAQIAAYGGRIREASVLYTRAVDMAMARQLRGTASSFWTHVALMDALYGDPRGSRARVQNTLNRAIASSDADSTAPRLRAVTALGLVGSAAEAGALLARAEERYPTSTLVRSLLIPAGRAAIALGRGRAEDTLAALGTDVTAEFGVVAGLIPTYLRGEAFLARRDGAAARREYQKVIDHRGIDPFSVLLPAVQLGIARAWALEGNREQGRLAYSELLRLWQNADRDLPLLVQARAEQAALKTGTPTPPASAVH